MIKYFCDRCGDETGNYFSSIDEIFSVTVASPRVRSWEDDLKTGTYILCYNCVKELNKFLEIKEKKYG